MDFSRIIWPLLWAMVTSAGGIFVGYFVELRFIHRRPFAEKVGETMRRLSFVEWRGEAKLQIAAAETAAVSESPRTYVPLEERFLKHLSRDANKAIGLGLITKEEVSTIASDSLSKSNLSFGLVLPLSLFLYAVAFRLQFHALGFSGVVFLVLVSNAALVLVGFERLYSYKWELQSLILGRFEKQQVDEWKAGQKG